MSRIGRLPIKLPKGVEVKLEGETLTVKGPKGVLTRILDPQIKVELADGQLVMSRSSDEPSVRALHGMTRALVALMVSGVAVGFRKSLEIVGVGYRGEVQGDDLVMQLGFSHPVRYPPPAGIKIVVEQGNRIIHVDGIDKELVGEVAAEIRALRSPEPYKGVGIRYMGEQVRRKAGKAGKVTAG
ncbi:MAG: 50S ribosomal protein L6 [Chloroflexi bacterium ADurb.Bin180]|nr:MAG: 50S ribosomal protein L6 [Chloroflexi bacterium ADurb.Bin180]HOU23890.1 50S ribosomal protein L6 [Anaerolineae bacterium]HQJ50677.1 50S ribosomal protein L6 [Anaerolineae bacterium]